MAQLQQTLSSGSRDISTPQHLPLPCACVWVSSSSLGAGPMPSLELQDPGAEPAPLLLAPSRHLGSALGWASSPCLAACPAACPAAQPSKQSQSSTGSTAGMRSSY